jgi:hypothetical protein
MKKKTDLNRRSFFRAGAKVIPALAVLGLATTVFAEPAHADCFGGTCRAVCADNCTESCKGDCMGDCKGHCGGCDTTSTGH